MLNRFGYECPSDDCPFCTGELCNKCGPSPNPPCYHDVLDRHEDTEMMGPGEPEDNYGPGPWGSD